MIEHRPLGRLIADPSHLPPDPARLVQAIIAGSPPWKSGGPYPPAPGAFGAAESLVAATGAVVRYEPDCEVPHYRRPPDDEIVLPPRDRFVGTSQWVGTLCHELIHWAEWRTGWQGDEHQGELVAEVGQGLLEDALGVPHCTDLTNHRRYARHWADEIKRSPTYLFDAVAQARRAAVFILTFSNPPGRGSEGGEARGWGHGQAVVPGHGVGTKL